MNTISREIPRRGPIGWVFLIAFVAFNAFMAVELVIWLIELSFDGASPESDKFILLGIIWPFGAVSSGVAALMTRTTVIHETFDGH